MTKNQCEDSGSKDEQFKGLTYEQKVEQIITSMSPQLNSKESRDIARAEIERIVADPDTFSDNLRDKLRDNMLILLQLETEIETVKSYIEQLELELKIMMEYEDLSGDGLTQIAYETRMDTFIGSISERDADTNDLGDVFKEMIGDIPALTKDSPPDRYQLMRLKHDWQTSLLFLEFGLEVVKMREARLKKAIERQMVMRNEMEREQDA